MTHRVIYRPGAIRVAGLVYRAFEGLSLGEWFLERVDSLKTFERTLAERSEAEPNLDGFSAPRVDDVVEQIAETDLVGVVG
jgi:hypothetical protein